MAEELDRLIAEAHAVASDAERIFGHLSAEQLNWKPAADQWSVAQCFEHLIRINSAYFPQFLRIEQGAYTPTWRDWLPVVGRFFGSMILGAVRPAARRKYKAARNVEPSASAIDDRVVSRFTAHQQDVIEHIERLASRDASRLVVTSPVAPFAFYSVMDALRILVTHERRHMAQAERVVRSDGFPRTRQSDGAR